MIEQHLLALLIVVPLLAAPVCLLLPNNRFPWLFATVITWIVFGLALLCVVEVLSNGSISYEMGGWAPPWGIEYRMDTLNAFVALLIAVIGSLVMPYAAASVEDEVQADKRAGFYAAYLLVFAGLLGITVTGDVFNLFVFLEISSLASYVLIALSERRRALMAAYQYLILGTIGATFLLIGIGLAYDMTGTLNMADLAVRLPAVYETRTVQTAFAFIAVGVGIKLALFPLHVWLPNAYANAPSVVTAFLAATATKVAFYALARFVYTVFGGEFVFALTPFGWAFVGLALAGMLCASAFAIFQDDIKLLLAYSSIAQIGYMVLGLAMGTALGLMAGVLHVFNHALMKAALFLAVGCLFFRLKSVSLGNMNGIGRDMPWTMAAFALAGLSLIGVPPTVGFISKWYLVIAALERGWWPVAVLILIASLLAVIYIWRVVEAAWLQPAPEGRGPLREAPLSMLIPTWVLVLANLYFGIDTRFTVGMATRAAADLLQVAP